MNKYIFLTLLISNTLNAKTYYFSNAGNDSYTTTQAQKQATAWKTIGKLNSFFSSLLPGDSVLFKRGETFVGTIVSSASGTAAKKITLDAYGTGVAPIISGLTTINTWTSIGNGIYESSVLSPEKPISVVIIGGKQYAIGRTPNSGYLTFESHTSSSLTDNTNPFTSAWNGSELVVRTSQYTIERNTATSISGNNINFSGGFDNLTDKFGYFLQNSIKTLDQYGEWYYNQTTHKLDVYFGSQGTKPVSFSSKNILLLLDNSYISLVGLTIKGAISYGIHGDISGAHGLYITGCNFLYCGINGMSIYGRNTININKCTFNWCNSSGINVGYADTLTTLTNSTFKNLGTFAGMLTPDETNRYGYGIFSENGLTCKANNFTNIGYIPVYFTMNNNLIQNNIVDTFCTVLSDGGGIYTYNYTPQGSTLNVWHNRVIRDNTVRNSIGAKEGTWDSDTSYNPAEGIYIDDNSMNVTVLNNTVSNCGDAGIYLHNSQNCTITGNTFQNNKSTQLLTQHSNPSLDVLGIVFKHNNLISNSASAILIRLNSENNDFANIGTFDSNYYCNPNTSTIIQTNWFGHTTANYTLNTWRSTYNRDIHTTECVAISYIDAKGNIKKEVEKL